MNQPSPAARRPEGIAPRRPQDPASPFFREGGRNRFTARRARVVSVTDVAPVIRRVRLSGPDFADFFSGGPSDHVRVFFPDPHTGHLVAPTAVGPHEDGIIRPDAPTLGRDFTPLLVADRAGGVAIDLDFFLHESPGPAAQWATKAAVGDELVIVGPRGSKAAPQRAARAIIVADEAALPAATRWLAELPRTTMVDVVASVSGDGEWVRDYLSTSSGRSDAHIHVLTASTALLTAVADLRPDASTYVFAAGEASRLVPLRRMLRDDTNLSPEQMAISGYWKLGVDAFDHHGPLDPDDPN